jgi:hypothetical protein
MKFPPESVIIGPANPVESPKRHGLRIYRRIRGILVAAFLVTCSILVKTENYLLFLCVLYLGLLMAVVFGIDSFLPCEPASKPDEY